ncbi:TetR family transcriptional regulator [Paenibacillus algorifonticola]|uniref:TetR family transcriptional regulator n=2 Tax=Paenibacillus algorifonticola TaxID=684063 RepID=UPI0006190AF3
MLSSMAVERDFESITVKDITEIATMNRATFYAHYEDKYMLLEVLFLEFFDQTLVRKSSMKAPSAQKRWKI